jgi:hypothetical protein
VNVVDLDVEEVIAEEDVEIVEEDVDVVIKVDTSDINLSFIYFIIINLTTCRLSR